MLGTAVAATDASCADVTLDRPASTMAPSGSATNAAACDSLRNRSRMKSIKLSIGVPFGGLLVSSSPGRPVICQPRYGLLVDSVTGSRPVLSRGGAGVCQQSFLGD